MAARGETASLTFLKPLEIISQGREGGRESEAPIQCPLLPAVCPLGLCPRPQGLCTEFSLHKGPTVLYRLECTEVPKLLL